MAPPPPGHIKLRAILGPHIILSKNHFETAEFRKHELCRHSADWHCLQYRAVLLELGAHRGGRSKERWGINTIKNKQQVSSVKSNQTNRSDQIRQNASK